MIAALYLWQPWIVWTLVVCELAARAEAAL